jgi:hypothetical protein
MGRKFSGSELVRENYILGKFARIPKQNSFKMSCFLFSISILRVELLRLIFRGKFSPVLNCLEDISVVRCISPLRWGQISWHYLKTIRK